MCTLIAAFHQFPDIPLLVAANRDEMLERPSAGPRLWSGPVRFVAPRDERAGGSWLGLNEHGLFVGITNRAESTTEPGKRSRGLLVTEGLGARSAVELSERLGVLDPFIYNSFHLFYADRTAAFLAVWDKARWTHQRLDRGVHVITERAPNAGDSPRGKLIHRLWQRDEVHPRKGMDWLTRLLSTHAAMPEEGICVHRDAFGYGTRSSSVLWVGDSPAHCRLWWAEGPPCRTPLMDRSELLFPPHCTAPL